MKVNGLDWTNNNAEARAIVIHNAWYAEPQMISQHGKLGRSEVCRWHSIPAISAAIGQKWRNDCFR